MTRTLGEGLGAKEDSPIEFFEYSYGASMYSPVMFFAVGTGGAIGAMLRYGISQLPPLSSSSSLFPVATLIVNVFGAFIIGLIAGCLIRTQLLSPASTSFWKAGFCGGLTTFSTFSLETVGLIDKGHWGIASGYIVASVVLTIIGVVVGRWIALCIWSNGS